MPTSGRARRSLASCALVLATSAAVGWGCGDKDRPPLASGTFTPSAGGGEGNEGGTGFGNSGGTKPPGCGVLADGGVCDCVDVALFADAPNIYFVLDHSGSMEVGGKWSSIRVTLGKLMRGIGPRANFGATMYPSNASCGTGTEVMSVRPGDPPSSSTDGPTTLQLLTVTNRPPSGGTPTAASLTYALDRVRNLPGKTFVILATDGGPNCNAAGGCDVTQCIPNIESAGGCSPVGQSCCAPPVGGPEGCLDTTASVAAVSALKAAGVPVYVIGVPGSQPYASVLNQMAAAGGTGNYFAVDAASETALLTALRKVAAKIIATCTFQLNKPPEDPTGVNVYLDDVVLPKEPANGWTLDGSSVTLTGEACRRVLDGEVLDVRIIAGCPTVIPR